MWTLRAPVVVAGLLGAIGLFHLSRADDTDSTPHDESSTAIPAAPRMSLYHADPKHPWNRLHAILFLRTDVEGRHHGDDEIDPLIWPGSYYLFEQPRYGQALAVLDEFLANEGGLQGISPLAGAMLQNDLWALFDQLAEPFADTWWPRGSDFEPQRQALRRRIAAAIRRLALTESEISALTDNYAQAVAAGLLPGKYNPAQPHAPFLPPDLFDSTSPWVCLLVDNGSQPTAPAHTQSFSGRSTFLVFLNLPAGREATVAYLQGLSTFPERWVLANHDEPLRVGEVVTAGTRLRVNPNLPQFPPGTQVALARRMMTIDELGRMVATPITESLQLRVYLEVPEARSTETSPPSESSPERFSQQQSVHEIVLRPSRLLRGEHGLTPLGLNDRSFIQFNAHPFDPFQAFPQQAPRRSVVLESCRACHSAAGSLSVQTVVREFTPLSARASTFAAEDRLSSAAWKTTVWKRQQFNWGLLRGYWEARTDARGPH
jgi:hypothetical protein